MNNPKQNPSQIQLHFPIFLKLNVQSVIFSKFLHENLFCYGACAQNESAKLQNTLACIDKTGLSCFQTSPSHPNRGMIGKSKEFEDVGVQFLTRYSTVVFTTTNNTFHFLTGTASP